MLAGTKLEYTRKYNRRIIVETIRRNGPISRVEIARLTGLTTATISNLTSELLQQDFIIESGRRKGQRGQPAIDLEISPSGRFSIGFEIGRDHLAAVLINLSGDILEELHREWKYPPPDVVLNLMTEGLQSLLKNNTTSSDRILGIGVAMPGPFFTDKKKVVMPIDFPNWERFPVVEELTKAFDMPIIMENDATAAAIGEQFHGKGRLYKDFYYLYLGTGIGAAMILDGHPYQGFSPNTGEIGNMKHTAKGRRAVISQFLSLDNLYSFLQTNGITASVPDDLETLFQQQNPALWEWLNEAVDCLETVIDAVNLIVGPEAIFLGGHFPNRLLDYLIERLEIELAAHRASQPDKYARYQAKLLRATSGDLSSALGAATLPLYEAFSTQYTHLQTTGNKLI